MWKLLFGKHICIHNQHTWANPFTPLRLRQKIVGFNIIIKQIIHVVANICRAAQQFSSKLNFCHRDWLQVLQETECGEESKGSNRIRIWVGNKETRLSRAPFGVRVFLQTSHTHFYSPSEPHVRTSCLVWQIRNDCWRKHYTLYNIIALNCEFVCSFVVSLIKLVRIGWLKRLMAVNGIICTRCRSGDFSSFHCCNVKQ